jgi:alpha-N-arabinofuranosidase
LCVGALSASTEPLYEFTPGPEDRASIQVDTSQAGEPISHRLFGKFCEHLGRNIYHGMWAQVMRNPGFEDWLCFFRDETKMKEAQKEAAEKGEPWPKGLAAQWLAEGSGLVTYKLDSDCINPQASQHITIKSLKSPAVGVRQEKIYLPLHRESDYQVSIYAKSQRIKTITLTVRDGDRILGNIEIGPLSNQWKKYQTRLTIFNSAEKGAPLNITVTANQTGQLWLDQLFIFPADNIHGFDREIVELCRKARLPLLRYPGGNFASGYHWTDGIGPMDKRPLRPNRPWNAGEYNHVGTDEFMAFCEAVGCEPMICVNAGDGTPEEAAQWIEYCNGSIESKFGQLRAKNGHPRPYNVTYWEVGNELYGKWQIGGCTPAEYGERYLRFVKAMRPVDPNIKLIANGYNSPWNGPILEKAAQQIRSFSIHYLIGMHIPEETTPTAAYQAMMACPTWLDLHLKELLEQMKKAGVKDPKIAMTEMSLFNFKRHLPTYYTLSEVVFMARVYHTAIRFGGKVEMITHSALVNHSGSIKKDYGVVYTPPTWLATHLYNTMEGTIPLAIKIKTGTYNARVKGVYPANNAPYIDAIALTNPERSLITLMVANTHPQKKIPTTIKLTDSNMIPASCRQVAGPSFMTRNSIENPNQVVIRNIMDPIFHHGGTITYTFPPHSVTELVFRK